MKKIMAVTAIALTSACANNAYNQQAQPADIEGFYFKSSRFMTSVVSSGVQVNKDGTGYYCTYANDGKAPKISPIKHIGGGEWVGPDTIMGARATITKNPDGTISYASLKGMVSESPENTRCKR